MKFAKYLLSLAAAAGLVTGCTKVDEVRAFDIGDVTAPVMHEIAEAIVITSENQDETFTFTWDAADFGYKAVIEYSILASYDGSQPLSMFSKINTTSYEVTYEALNTKLALAVEDGGLGLPVNEESMVEFYVGATIGTGYETVLSKPVAASVTATAAEKTYPFIWVMGDYSGWSYDNAQHLYSFTKDEVVYEGVVDFGEKAANGFKFSGALDWGDNEQNWGLDGDAEAPEAEAASIVLISSGGSANIMCYSKRFYKFSFDRSTLTLTKVFGFDKLGIVGDATPGGWDADTEMEFNPAKRRFWVDAEMKEGTFKFRADGGWDTNWGSDNSDGNLSAGGGDIKVTEGGKVRVYAYLSNSNELKYELNARMYGQPENGDEPGPGPGPEPEYDWYIHGQTVATPDWGRTPLEKDAASGGYKALNVEFEAMSQFLFTDGDAQWIGADASLKNATVDEEGVFSCTVGEAFATSADKVNVLIEAAGTFDIWFFPAKSEAYVMLPGETPGDVPVVEKDRWGLVGTISNWGNDGVPDLYMDAAGEGMFVRKGVALATDDQFKIRFNNEWNDAKNYGLDGGNGTIDPNTAVKLITAGNSGNIGISAAGTYDVYFNLTDEKVYVMDPGKTPADAEDPKPGPGPDLTDDVWGIVGTLTGWADGADLEMTAYAAMEQTFVRTGVALTAADLFKVRANNKWDDTKNYGLDGGEGLVAVDTKIAVITSGGSGNMKVAADGTYDIYFDLGNAAIYVMTPGKTPADAEDPEPGPGLDPTDVWGIVGSMTGWADGADLELAQEGNYYVRKGIAFEASSDFKIRKNGKWDVNYGVDDLTPVNIDEAVALTLNSMNNVTLAAPGTYDVYFDLAAEKLYVMTAGKTPADAVDPTPSTDTWGIVGTVSNWGTDPDLEMTSYAPMKNTFVRKGVALTTSDEFKIRANGEWNNAKNYGRVGGNGIVETDKKVIIYTGGDSGNMKVAADGTYDIYFDLDGSAVYIMTAGRTPDQA